MLTADELDQACDVLIEHEGLVPWLYCDTRGFVTVGVGDKVGTKTVLTMPFTHLVDGSPADTEEKLIAYARVLDMFNPNFLSGMYSRCSDLRLDAAFCRRRLAYRVKHEFVPAVEKHCPQLESFPTVAKRVLVDIAYNVGAVGFADFDQLIVDCNAGNFAQGSFEVHTKKEDEDPKRPETWGRRNRWRLQTMALAAKEATK